VTEQRSDIQTQTSDPRGRAKRLRQQAKALKKEAKAIEAELDNKGLRCPKCGCGHFETDKTVPIPGRRIRRYKVCRYCGRRVRTTETIEE